MSAQLPLALRWPAQQRFATFVAGDNGASVELVRGAAQAQSFVYVHGAPASGKTHLLIAACADAAEHARSAQYFSLKGLDADAIRALGGGDLLALDDLDAIAGNAAAEHALFDLYNRCKVEKCTLLFGARAAPGQLGIGLRDLVSRLSACAQALLKPLDDDARRVALRARAQARGLTLDDAVLDWLFAHTQRDLGSLTALIDKLDRASLAAKRRITVPFLKEVIDAENR